VPPFVYIENHRVIGHDAKDPIKIGGKTHTKVMEGKGAGRIGGAKEAHDLYVDDQIGINLTERSVQWIEEREKINPSSSFSPLQISITHSPLISSL